jgi:predicted nuclease of predicted toxin-antitoxin system
VKLLVDMDLSPRWIPVFHMAGFVADHWSDVGNVRASDSEVIAYARAHDYVVVTRDLGFSALLAASGAGQPSVVQIRAGTANPEAIGDTVIEALLKMAEALSTGAVLTIDPARARLRLLPLR